MIASAKQAIMARLEWPVLHVLQDSTKDLVALASHVRRALPMQTLMVQWVRVCVHAMQVSTSTVGCALLVQPVIIKKTQATARVRSAQRIYILPRVLRQRQWKTVYAQQVTKEHLHSASAQFV